MTYLIILPFNSNPLAQQTICTKTVMDTTDPNITFDSDGVCNHYYEFQENAKKDLKHSPEELNRLISQIKSNKNGKYDAVIGLSGGVDSSYVALKAHELGLKPIIVHLDNGWNSELAVQNITQIIQQLGFDLHTHVINWNEFKELQRAYFKASVIDVEVLTDHAITAFLYKLASKLGVKYILSGTNVNSESIMPKAWVYQKNDAVNIRAIAQRYGRVKLKTFPLLGLEKQLYYKHVKGINYIALLDYLNFDKEKAKLEIQEKLGWRDYGGKHHESIFTRFYQSYYLPKKFNVDKRKAHLSSLICAGQITREKALEELRKPLYASESLEREDLEYVTSKLDFTQAEFDQIMQAAPISHYDYPNDSKKRELAFNRLQKSYRKLFPVKG